jgi:hypothetical protein
MKPLAPHFIPKVASYLPQRSADYFYETREKLLGAPLSEIAKQASEENWKEADAPLKETGELLRKHDGPFFLGETGESPGQCISELWLTTNSVLCRLHTRFVAAYDEVYRRDKVRACHEH